MIIRPVRVRLLVLLAGALLSQSGVSPGQTTDSSNSIPADEISKRMQFLKTVEPKTTPAPKPGFAKKRFSETRGLEIRLIEQSGGAARKTNLREKLPLRTRTRNLRGSRTFTLPRRRLRPRPLRRAKEGKHIARPLPPRISPRPTPQTRTRKHPLHPSRKPRRRTLPRWQATAAPVPTSRRIIFTTEQARRLPSPARRPRTQRIWPAPSTHRNHTCRFTPTHRRFTPDDDANSKSQSAAGAHCNHGQGQAHAGTSCC